MLALKVYICIAISTYVVPCETPWYQLYWRVGDCNGSLKNHLQQRIIQPIVSKHAFLALHGNFSELWSLVKDNAPVWVILWSLARRMFFSQQDTFESMTGALHHKQTTTDDNY